MIWIIYLLIILPLVLQLGISAWRNHRRKQERERRRHEVRLAELQRLVDQYSSARTRARARPPKPPLVAPVAVRYIIREEPL